MADIYDSLLTIQNAAAAALAANSVFEGMDIITEDQGNLANRIASSLSKLGISVCVMTPLAVPSKRIQGRTVWTCTLVVECAETAVLNKGRGIPALRAALAAAIALDEAANGMPGRQELSQFVLHDERAIELIPDPRQLVYHVRVTTSFLITKQ